MALIAKAKQSNFDYTPAPVGIHKAVCCSIQDLGLLESTWNGVKSMKHKIKISWMLESKNKDNQDRNFIVSNRYNLSLHENSGLRKHIRGWLGRDLTEQEVNDGWDVEQMLGKSCQIMIAHNPKDGKVYASVEYVANANEDYSKTIPWRDYTPKAPKEVKVEPSKEEPPHFDEEASDIPF